MRSQLRVPILLGSAALLLIAVAAVIFVSEDTVLGRQSDPVVIDDGQVYEREASISIEEAISIALNHADGKVDDVDLKHRGGTLVYDIEIGDTDIVIDANDGTVIHIDHDDDDDDRNGNAAGNTTSTADIISQDEAVSIARTVAEGDVRKIELDEDDGRLEYEIEIGNYDIEIDAVTGEILDVDHDDDDDRDDVPAGIVTTSDMISQDEAIEIARTVADGNLHKVELDEDDGRLEYEIEIGNYDVEIDAITGEILDVDYDD